MAGDWGPFLARGLEARRLSREPEPDVPDEAPGFEGLEGWRVRCRGGRRGAQSTRSGRRRAARVRGAPRPMRARRLRRAPQRPLAQKVAVDDAAPLRLRSARPSADPAPGDRGGRALVLGAEHRDSCDPDPTKRRLEIPPPPVEAEETCGVGAGHVGAGESPTSLESAAGGGAPSPSSAASPTVVASVLTWKTRTRSGGGWSGFSVPGHVRGRGRARMSPTYPVNMGDLARKAARSRTGRTTLLRAPGTSERGAAAALPPFPRGGLASGRTAQREGRYDGGRRGERRGAHRNGAGPASARSRTSGSWTERH